MKEAISFFRKYKFITAAIIITVEYAFYTSNNLFFLNTASPFSAIIKAITGSSIVGAEKIVFWLFTAVYVLFFVGFTDFKKKYDVWSTAGIYAAFQVAYFIYANIQRGTVFSMYDKFIGLSKDKSSAIASVMLYYNCEIYMLAELIFAVITALIVGVVYRHKVIERKD